MFRLILISILLSMLFLTGCHQDEKGVSMSPEYNDRAESMATNTSTESYNDSEQSSAQKQSENLKENSAPDDTPMEPMIMKSANLSIESNDLGRSKGLMDSILGKFEGYYEREDFSANYYEDRFEIVVRLKANKFDHFLDFISKSGNKILSKSITANDVTEEYVDIQSRVENNEAYIAQYRSLLTKAKTIKEILDIKNQIRRLEEEKDARLARLKYLKTRVDLSTIRISLIQKTNRKREEVSFGSKIKDAFGDSLTLVSSFFLFLIRIWPFIIMVVFAIWGFRKWRNS